MREKLGMEPNELSLLCTLCRPSKRLTPEPVVTSASLKDETTNTSQTEGLPIVAEPEVDLNPKRIFGAKIQIVLFQLSRRRRRWRARASPTHYPRNDTSGIPLP